MTRTDISFSGRVARGGAWMLGLQFAGRVLTLVQTIILARLLVPRDFGLVGIALLVLATAEALTQTGVESALIYQKSPGRRELDTAWTVSLLRGLILFVAALAAAPAVARFFDAPAVEPLVPVLGFSFLLKGATNVGVIHFRRDLEFGKQFAYEFSGIVPNLVVSVVLAVVLRNAWAIALGVLAGQAALLAASYVLHPYRPRPGIHRSSLRGLYQYGKWIFGTNLLTFLANKGDDLFVGRMLGAAPLGLYQMAFRIGEKPREDLTAVISKVAFPAYALIKDEGDRLRRTYRIGLESTSAVAFPLVGAVVVLAPELTAIFLGDDWMPMVPALRVLTVAGAIRALLALGGNLSHGVGRPDLNFKMNLFRLLVMAAAIYPLAVRWELVGTAGAVLLGLLGATPVWLVVSTRFGGLRPSEILAALAPSLGGSALMVLALTVLKLALDSVGVVAFAGLGIAGAAVYLGFCYVLWRGWNLGPVKTGLLLHGALVR